MRITLDSISKLTTAAMLAGMAVPAGAMIEFSAPETSAREQAARRAIDAAVSDIARAMGDEPEGAVFGVGVISPEIGDLHVESVNPFFTEHGEAGRVIELEVLQTVSPARMEIMLGRVGGSADSLPSALILEFTGRLGSTDLTIPGNTAYAEFPGIISQAVSDVGIEVLSSMTFGDGTTSVVLDGGGFGSSSFISVRVFDDGGATAALRALDPVTPFQSFGALETSGNPARVFGRDVRVAIAGVEVEGRDNVVSPLGIPFSGSCTLRVGDLQDGGANASNLGRIERAFKIRRSSGNKAVTKENPGLGPAIVLRAASPEVLGVSVGEFNEGSLPDGEDTRTFALQVVRAATFGSLNLETNTAALDLGGQTSALVIQIGGAIGEQQFSFSSGTTLSDAAATVNTFTDEIGVQATASAGSAILFRSTQPSESDFVSISIVNDGGLVATVAIPEGPSVEVSDLERTGESITDFGTRLQVVLDLQVLDADGTRVHVPGLPFSGFFDLRLGEPLVPGGANASNTGTIPEAFIATRRRDSHRSAIDSR